MHTADAAPATCQPEASRRRSFWLGLWLALAAVCDALASPHISSLGQARLGALEVQLPHAWAADHAPHDGPMRYSLRVWLETAPEQVLAIFVMQASAGAQLYLNGHAVSACLKGSSSASPCTSQPWLSVPDPDLWLPGDNLIELELVRRPWLSSGLSAVHIGPWHVLHEDMYNPRYLWQVQAPRVLGLSLGGLGLISLAWGLMGRQRRWQRWMGTTSLMMGLGHREVFADLHETHGEGWSSLLVASHLAYVPLLMVSLLVVFKRERAWQRMLALLCVAMAPVWVVLGPQAPTGVLIFHLLSWAAGAVLLSAMVRWTWRSRQGLHGGLVLCAGLLLADIQGQLQKFTGTAGSAHHHAGPDAGLMLQAMLILVLLWQWLQDRLAHQHARHLEQARQRARMQEREHWIAELHDGLANGLSSAQMLLHQGRMSTQDAARVMRESMDDLRLVFDVSSALESELFDLVLQLRQRMDPRLKAAGVRTHWHIALDDFPAWQAGDKLHLLRLLQEALNNALRHAQARELEIELRWQAPELLLRVRDDGLGLDQTGGRAGRGLRHMAKRASELGGKLQIEAAHPGTVVQMRLQWPSHAKVARKTENIFQGQDWG